MDFTTLLPVAGALLGAGSSGNASSSQTRTPWGPAQPWLTQNLGLGQAMQNAYLANPLSALQQQAYSRAFDTTNQGRALGNNLLRQMSSTKFFDRTNPTARPSAWSFDVTNPNVATGPNLGFGGINFSTAMPMVTMPAQMVSNAPQVSGSSSSSSRSSWEQPSSGSPVNGDPYGSFLASLSSLPVVGGIGNFLASQNNGYGPLSGANGYADARDAAARGLGVGNTEPRGDLAINNAIMDARDAMAASGDNGGTNITDSQVAAAVNAANNYTPSYSQSSDGSYSFSPSSDSEDSSGSSSSGYAKGGMVKKSSLSGPNPKGPDEGKANLQSGEYVIRKSAVKKYGKGLLSAINEGKA